MSPSGTRKASSRTGVYGSVPAKCRHVQQLHHAHTVSSASVLQSSSGKQPTAVETAFMVCGALRASLDNSQGGSPSLALGFSFNNLMASGSFLFHPRQVQLLDVNSVAVLLTTHFSFQLSQPEWDCRVSGSTIVYTCLSLH